MTPQFSLIFLGDISKKLKSNTSFPEIELWRHFETNIYAYILHHLQPILFPESVLDEKAKNTLRELAGEKRFEAMIESHI